MQSLLVREGQKDFSVVASGMWLSHLPLAPAFRKCSYKDNGIVDTHLPLVSKVWNTVESKKGDYTSIIHGYNHEETIKPSAR